MTIPRHLLIACVLAICPGATLFVCCMHARDIANGYSIIGSTSGFLPASIKAAPDLECRLHARGSAITSGLPIFTDGDGYARFYALKGNTIGRYQTLTCTDNDGRRHTYNLDLVSKAYFVKRPLDLSKERGIERPPLTGDPLSYTQAELSQKGYGLRPKPDAQIYSVWLEAARKPARMLFAKKTGRIRSPTSSCNSFDQPELDRIGHDVISSICLGGGYVPYAGGYPGPGSGRCDLARSWRVF
jgi:hypothetical protein